MLVISFQSWWKSNVVVHYVKRASYPHPSNWIYDHKNDKRHNEHKLDTENLSGSEKWNIYIDYLILTDMAISYEEWRLYFWGSKMIGLLFWLTNRNVIMIVFVCCCLYLDVLKFDVLKKDIDYSAIKENNFVVLMFYTSILQWFSWYYRIKSNHGSPWTSCCLLCILSLPSGYTFG